MGHHSKLSPCGDHPPGTASPRGRPHLTSMSISKMARTECLTTAYSTTLRPHPELQSHAVRKRAMQRALACAQVWVHEQADGRLDIVDGKQRITSLLSYLDGIFPRNQQTFALEANSSISALQAGTQTHTSLIHYMLSDP